MIFAITGLLVVTIILRFFLVLFAASSDHFVSKLIIGMTDPLLVPFDGMFAETGFGSLQVQFEMIVAAIFYIFAGILFSSFVLSFLQEKVGKILIELLDVVFKSLEFILLARLLLKMFGIAPGSAFVNTIFINTEWVAGLLPSVDLLGGILEFSTLFILVGVVILDLVTEGAFEAGEKKSNNLDLMMAAQTTVIAPPPPNPNRQHAQPQNITINIPVPKQQAPQQPRMVAPQVINVNKPQNPQSIPYNSSNQ